VWISVKWSKKPVKPRKDSKGSYLGIKKRHNIYSSYMMICIIVASKHAFTKEKSECNVKECNLGIYRKSEPIGYPCARKISPGSLGIHPENVEFSHFTLSQSHNGEATPTLFTLPKKLGPP